MVKATKSKQTRTNTKKGTAPVKRENKAEVLDPKEQEEKQNQLKECEKIIHDKTDSFIEVIVQLTIIQENNLYQLKVGSDNKPLFKSFERYIDAEFGFKRAYYSRLKSAYDTYKQIETKVPKDELEQLPKYPAFYVALSEIEEEKRIEAIEAVKKKAGTNKRMRGSDITRWGNKNTVMVKKQSDMPSGIVKQVQIFTGLVNALAGVESIAEDIKNIKEYNEEKKKNLINNLQKILDNLK